MRVVQPPSTKWEAIQGKPSVFPSEWSQLSGKPAVFPSQWDQVAGKPTTFPSDWGQVANKPTVYPSQWDQVAGKPTTFPPNAHASQHAQGQPDALTPDAIGAASSSAIQVSTDQAYMRSVWASERPGAFKRLVAWGLNNYGQLGDNTTTTRVFPVRVLDASGLSSLNNILAVAAAMHSLAVSTDGMVWAWGQNTSGQLGDNTTTHRSLPVRVLGPGATGYLTGIVAVAANQTHSLALREDGTVWAWGDNINGQLGTNTTVSSLTPVQVLGPGGSGFLTNIVAIAAGQYFSLALREDGTVWAWGKNGSGQLGDGTQNDRLTPVQVKGPGGTGYLTNVVAIHAVSSHCLALRADGTVWAWGYNPWGQLGDNTTTTRVVPVQVLGPGAVGYLTDVVTVGSGTGFSLAVKRDGTVWAWGNNSVGNLGDGTTTNRFVPVQVRGPGGAGYLTGIVAVAGGSYFSMALKTDGTLWGWGRNVDGSLGDGTVTNRLTPVQVLGPNGMGYITGVIAIATGASSHCLARYLA